MVALKDSEASVRGLRRGAWALEVCRRVVVPGLVRTAAHEGAEGVGAAMAALDVWRRRCAAVSPLS